MADILETIDASVEQTENVTDEGRRIVRASTLLRRGIREVPMLYAPIFSKTGIAILAGSSDGGKSQLLRNMAICVATGKSFLGLPYKGEHKSAIFVSSEDDDDSTAFLLTRHQETFGMSPEEVNSLRFIFDSDNVLQHLNEELTLEPADLIICDAFSDIFDGSEMNSATDTRRFLNSFKELAQQHKCLIIFLHHISKAKEALAPSKNNLVGSESLQALPRLVIELRSDRENLDLKHFCIVKGNYLSNKYKTASYVLKMDENFVFSNTGDRVPFNELAEGATRTHQQCIRPENYAKEQHEELLRRVAYEPVSKRTLSAAVENELKVSDKVARSFVESYIKNGMLKEIPSKPYPKYVIASIQLSF